MHVMVWLCTKTNANPLFWLCVIVAWVIIVFVNAKTRSKVPRVTIIVTIFFVHVHICTVSSLYSLYCVCVHAGVIPWWVNGRLMRNGPGIFEVGDTSYHHLFDGLARIHSFTILNGKLHVYAYHSAISYIHVKLQSSAWTFACTHSWMQQLWAILCLLFFSTVVVQLVEYVACLHFSPLPCFRTFYKSFFVWNEFLQTILFLGKEWFMIWNLIFSPVKVFNSPSIGIRNVVAGAAMAATLFGAEKVIIHNSSWRHCRRMGLSMASDERVLR